MKMILFVCAIGFLFLCMSGCQCGCLENQESHGEAMQSAYQDRLNPSYPVVSMEMEIQADYGKSF